MTYCSDNNVLTMTAGGISYTIDLNSLLSVRYRREIETRFKRTDEFKARNPMESGQGFRLPLLNCFGRQHQGGSVLAIITRGDFFCHVVTEMNRQGKNRIYASFGVRHHESEPIKQEDKELLVQ